MGPSGGTALPREYRYGRRSIERGQMEVLGAARIARPESEADLF